MIGETVSHYKIIEQLGAGGMGVVYKAEDLILHRIVALKFPPDAFTRDESSAARLMNEARMSASLLHSNVAVLYEVDEYQGHPFLVMEFVDGQTLRRLLDDHGPLPLDRWIDVAIQICEGIGAVHRKKMIHRDIKTENILFSKAEEVKIVDCGLGARIIDAEHLAEELGVAGTTAYMSPEQVRGEQLDQRSDIFSIGVVLYELLTGKLPFEARQQSALMYLITSVDPPSLHALRSNIPDDIAAVVHRALEKDPVRRYQNVGEILRDLRKIQQSLVK